MKHYEQAGVDYSSLDAAKLMILQAASATSSGLKRWKGRSWVRPPQ